MAPLAPFVDRRVDLRDGVVADASKAVVIPDVTLAVLCGRSAWLASNSCTSTPLLAAAFSRARLARGGADLVLLVSLVEDFVFMTEAVAYRGPKVAPWGADRRKREAHITAHRRPRLWRWQRF